MAMIASPKTLALRTSSAASSTTVDALVGVERRARVAARASASRRTAFSTMITAPSTMRPKSMAPRLIRFPEAPVSVHHA